MRTFSRSWVPALLLATSVVATGLGCGGGNANSPEGGSAELGSLPPAPETTVLVNVKAGSSEAEAFVPNVTNALTTSMTSTGYKLVTSKEANPDVVANVTVNATAEKSLFAVQVNGQTKVSYAVKVAASFVAASDAAVIDQATTEFSGEDGAVDQNAIDRILVHLGKTKKLHGHAAGLKAKAADAQAKVAQAEEDLWKAANVDGCKKPTTKTACDGVNAYVKEYPKGKYTADARAAIQEGETALTAMKEEDAWKAAVVDQCKKPTKSYDCVDVEGYLKAYPTGKYAADAKAAMKSSEKAREGLKKQEDAKKKAANREECIKECRRAYETYAYFEILSNRCIQTDCN